MIFRTPPRAAILAIAFLLGAGFFATGAAPPSASAGARLALGGVALAFSVVALRCARMRIVASDACLKLYGPLFNQAIRWADIRTNVAAESGVDARTFGVRTPVIVLTSDRKVKAQPVSSYSFSGGTDTPADRIAGQLEALRQSS
ncbi:hypothetical protein [Actinoplanes sp. NPDC049681]|uniref:hypothetical protein n=1 Tax=Actinoplanes sp. NPDC049681 TaxID=3363905 RepID=UPI00378986AC